MVTLLGRAYDRLAQRVGQIAAVDATPDARTFNEYTWAGDLQDIDEDWAMEILRQTQGASFISRMRDPKPIAAVKRADGTWVIPMSEG